MKYSIALIPALAVSVISFPISIPHFWERSPLHIPAENVVGSISPDLQHTPSGNFVPSAVQTGMGGAQNAFGTGYPTGTAPIPTGTAPGSTGLPGTGYPGVTGVWPPPIPTDIPGVTGVWPPPLPTPETSPSTTAVVSGAPPVVSEEAAFSILPVREPVV